MLFAEPLIEGRLLRRYKRFFADVALCDGSTVVAHCPNPGAMRSCSPTGARVWLMHHRSATRRLAYTWEVVETEHAMVCVNTARANDVVAEALGAGLIPELAGHTSLTREVMYGAGSRIDFLLTHGERACYVEVKNVTLRHGDRMAAFPDAITTRGTKHLVELMDMVAAGHRAALVFCLSRTDARSVQPADAIDPLYGQVLREAAAAGVELYAYRCDVSPDGLWLRERVPVLLPEPDEATIAAAARARVRFLRELANAMLKRGAKKAARLAAARE